MKPTHRSFALALLLAMLACAAGANAAYPAPAATSSIVQIGGVTQPLHITVGHSLLLNVPSLLRRVYISDPKVLASLTASPTQLLVTANAPGESSLVIWNANGESQIYSVSADADVDGLRRALAGAFPLDRIEAAALGDRVTLTGVVEAKETAGAADKLASLYAKQVVDSLQVLPPRIKQVRLKVRIAEVDRSRAAQFGFTFLSGGNNVALAGTQQLTAFGLTAIGSASAASAGVAVTNPLNLLLYNNNLNVGAALADLEQKNILQILAEPTITSLSGQPASFLSGGQFPFPVVQGGSGNFISVTVQFRPYGVKLDFTPFVNPDGTILLKVAPEVSALDYTNAVKISGYEIPAIATRRAETEVELRDGQSFAISGLLDHRLTDAFSHMPGIASVPILGELFRSKNNTASTVELIVIVTPEIVDPLSTPVPTPALPKLAKPYMDSRKFDQNVNRNAPGGRP